MKKKLIVGNWKMNPETLSEARRIASRVRRAAESLDKVEPVICPPFPFMSVGFSRKKPAVVVLGAQSVSEEKSGAHTGEVSAAMLSDIGARYVIVGHSEEREKGMNDASVAKRALCVLEAEMKPIICFGEKSRDENGEYLEALKSQIRNSLSEIPKKFGANIVVAYEPVWAIGGSEAMKPADIHESAIFVKKVFADIFGQEAAMNVPVLYGGSVNYRSAGDIIGIGRVDGLLVGRESVNAPGFVELMKAANQAAGSKN